MCWITIIGTPPNNGYVVLTLGLLVGKAVCSYSYPFRSVLRFAPTTRSNHLMCSFSLRSSFCFISSVGKHLYLILSKRGAAHADVRVLVARATVFVLRT